MMDYAVLSCMHVKMRDSLQEKLLKKLCAIIISKL